LLKNFWLENFAYRTTLGISVFVFAAVIGLVLMLIAIGTMVIKATITNPVYA
jgi:putative ABC transport system permease protein